MTSPCTFLAWDSEFFGQRIARVEGGRLTEGLQINIDQWCIAQKIACLYFLADFDDDATIRIAERAGYHLVDVRVTLGCALEKTILLSTQVDGIGVRMVTEADVPRLIEMSRDQFRYSRFYQDHCFSRDCSRSLFSTWIAKSSQTDGADRVLVADVEQQPVGYLAITQHTDQGIGQFALMAVAPPTRVRSIGTALVDQGIRIFREQNLRELRIITQGRNIGSQQLFQKFGLRTKQTQLWYHKWFSNCDTYA